MIFCVLFVVVAVVAKAFELRYRYKRIKACKTAEEAVLLREHYRKKDDRRQRQMEQMDEIQRQQFQQQMEDFQRQQFQQQVEDVQRQFQQFSTPMDQGGFQPPMF